MSSTKSKLRVVCAFAALAFLALAVSCKGFFPHNQLASIVVVPTTATVPLGGTTQLHAFGVNQDNTQAGDVTNQVTWHSDSGAITVTNGLLTGASYSATPATISASYQALPAQTATATICVEGATNFQIVPANTSASSTGTFPNGGGYTASVDALVSGVSQTVDITAAVQWTTSDPAVVTITNGTNPAAVSYPGGQVTGSPTVTVTANYTCNGVAYTPTPTTKLTVTP